MATYRAIASTEVDADSPVTETLMTALADNPTAIAEGASGAPKIAVSVATASAGAASTLTITGLDDFSGIIIQGTTAYSGGTNGTLTVELSDDSGGTWGAASTIVDLVSTESTTYFLWVDLVTGDAECIYHDSGTQERQTPTIANASAAVTDLRITTSANMTVTAMALPNGGPSAS